MKTYFVHLSIGYIGCKDATLIQEESEKGALETAHAMCWELYESYAGLHGIPGMGDLEADMDHQLDADELLLHYEMMVEEKLDYYVEEYVPTVHNPKLPGGPHIYELAVV